MIVSISLREAKTANKAARLIHGAHLAPFHEENVRTRELLVADLIITDSHSALKRKRFATELLTTIIQIAMIIQLSLNDEWMLNVITATGTSDRRRRVLPRSG
jgi:hypothetical protein